MQPSLYLAAWGKALKRFLKLWISALHQPGLVDIEVYRCV